MSNHPKAHAERLMALGAEINAIAPTTSSSTSRLRFDVPEVDCRLAGFGLQFR
jgi:hypothetical protein